MPSAFRVVLCHIALAQNILHCCCLLHDTDHTDDLSLLQMRTAVNRDSNVAMQVVGSTKIPCYIHQTWKTNDTDKLVSWMKQSVDAWRKTNPGCKHKIWSDEEVETFMQTNYPKIAAAWPVLKPIERADLFRYAVVHTFGGFYSDIDVMDIFPISWWPIPADTELVVGYETGWHFDEDTRKQALFRRNEQFEQWFFGAVPGHPVLKECLNLFQEKRQWGIEEVVELTGPGSFTDAIHEYFWSAVAKKTGKSIGEAETAMEQGRESTQGMIFPPGPGPEGSHVYILSADQVSVPGFSSHITPNILIRHTFKGTWKKH